MAGGKSRRERVAEQRAQQAQMRREFKIGLVAILTVLGAVVLAVVLVLSGVV